MDYELDLNKTYVFKDDEVKWTGRVAARTGQAITQRSRERDVLYEITTLDPQDTLTMWVTASQLYTIYSTLSPQEPDNDS